MGVWLGYYAARMRLARELGIMKLNQDGTWQDDPLPGSSRGESLDVDSPVPEELPLPPRVSIEWTELLDLAPPLPDAPLPADIYEPFEDPVPGRPSG